MCQLKDQVAIITGSSRGIGRVIAQKMAEEGAKVTLCGTKEETLQDVSTQMAQETGADVDYAVVDVSQVNDVQALVAQVMDKHGRIDVLVNNAGVTRDNLLLRMSEDEWNKVIDINLKGAFLCTKAVLKSMIKARYGRIVNVASVVGVMGNSGQANYAASKAGMIGFSKSVAKEVATRNINVNVVAPGYIETGMTSVLPEKVTEAAKTIIPQGRLGQPEDVAGLILFLTSDASSYITGQVVHVDGGMVM